MVDKKKQNRTHDEWVSENTIRVSVKLNKNTDTDIIDYVGPRMGATELKRLIRLGIAAEKEHRDG